MDIWSKFYLHRTEQNYLYIGYEFYLDKKFYGIINPGDKIAQLLVYRVELPSFEELPNDVPLYSQTQTKSGRGDNGFGSTGC